MSSDSLEELRVSVQNEEMSAAPDDTPFVFFMLNDKAYGVSSSLVLSMHTFEDCTPIVDFPPHIRGVVDFRGTAISLCDMRALFNMRSSADELDEMIAQRTEDHKKWVSALERSVMERTPFTLTTDPHQCAFGKWYDSFQTDNSALRNHLEKIGPPHQSLHNAAIAVKERAALGDYEGALELVEKLKATHFQRTLSLLSQVGAIYRQGLQEIVIVLELEDKTFGIIVDKILSVEPVTEVIPMPEGSRSEYVSRIAKRSKEPHLVLLLDCDKL